MKKTLFIIGLLLLAGCSSAKADHVTSWGTHFVYDDAKTHAIHHELYECLQNVTEECPKCYGTPDETPKDLKAQAASCDNDYWESIKITEKPPTFYGLSGQKDDADLYGEFVLCVHSLVNPMWDLPEGYTASMFHKSIQECLKTYPGSRT